MPQCSAMRENVLSDGTEEVFVCSNRPMPGEVCWHRWRRILPVGADHGVPRRSMRCLGCRTRAPDGIRKQAPDGFCRRCRAAMRRP